MQMEMDRTNKIESFEEILMFNPLDPKSPSEAKDIVKMHDYYTSVYPDHVMNKYYEDIKLNQ